MPSQRAAAVGLQGSHTGRGQLLLNRSGCCSHGAQLQDYNPRDALRRVPPGRPMGRRGAVATRACAEVPAGGGGRRRRARSGAGTRAQRHGAPPSPAASGRPRPAERLPLAAAPAGSERWGGGRPPGAEPGASGGGAEIEAGAPSGLPCGRRRAGLRRPRRRPLSPLGSEDAAGAVRMEQIEGEGGGGGPSRSSGFLKGPRPPCLLLPALRRGPGAGGDGRRWAADAGPGCTARCRPRVAPGSRLRSGLNRRSGPCAALRSGCASRELSGRPEALRYIFSDNFVLCVLNQRQRAIAAVGKGCSLSWCSLPSSCGW